MFVHAADGNLVELYWLPQKNEFESTRAGKVVFDKLLMIRVVSPGMTAQEPHFWVEHHYASGNVKRNDLIYKRYAPQIEEFKRTDGQMSESGYPIDKWPEIDVAQAETLKYHKVHTVEALANLSDTAVQTIGLGGLELRRKAQAFVSARTAQAPVDDPRLKQLEEQNRALMEQVQKLNAQLNAQILNKSEDAGEVRRGPGRPPKAASA